MRSALLLSWILLAGCQAREGADLVVDLDALVGHLEVLQDEADTHDGTRSLLGDGYEGSVDYLVERLEGAGYEVILDPFEITAYYLESAVLQEQGEDPLVIGRAHDADWRVVEGSGDGDVTAPAVAVDVVIPGPSTEDTSTSGCQAGDFDDFPAGSIALIQRGTCTFDRKVRHAQDAGATGVVLFNEGSPDRESSLFGSFEELEPTVPVAAVAYAIGADWATRDDAPTLHLAVQGEVRSGVQHNVIAEIEGQRTDRVVMLGAHLDSVKEGPGINDNGSGSALLLEMALEAAAAGWQPRNGVRFAWWGAEEIGLVGSWYWVHDESTGEPDAVDDLMAYLNYDMVASGDGRRQVYPAGQQPAEAGAEEIEALYGEWFDGQGLPWDTDLPPATYFGSDVLWFARAGVPSGGLFTGLDPCYHKACDRLPATDPVLFEEMAGAAFFALERLGERQDDLPDAVDTARLDRSTGPRTPGPPPVAHCHDHAAHALAPR